MVKPKNLVALVDLVKLVNFVGLVDSIKSIKLVGLVDSIGLKIWFLVSKPKFFVRLALTWICISVSGRSLGGSFWCMLDEGYNFALDLTLIGGLHKKL